MHVQILKDTKIYRNYLIVNDWKDGDQKDLADEILVGNLTAAFSEKDKRLGAFISHLKSGKDDNGNFPVAQKGRDAVVVLGETLVIFQNSDSSEVRKFIKDTENYTHKFEIKTAEYHTYVNSYPITSPDEKLFFGGAVTPKGGFFGRLYVRNDDYYDKKYFKGSVFRDESNQNPHFDRGSVALEFAITEKQYKELLIKLNYDKVALWKNNFPFNFIGINGDNCADYANNTFKFLGFKDDFSSYYQIDQLDDRDMGIFYYQYSHNYEYIPFNFRDLIDQATCKFLGDEAGKIAHKLLLPTSYISNWLYQKFNYFDDQEIHIAAYKNNVSYLENSAEISDVVLRNKYGETALHTALKNGSFEFANRLLDFGADVDAKDYKGHSALYTAASLKHSAKKNEILEKMLNLTTDVDGQDDAGYFTNLTSAVASNDTDAVNLFLKYGANFNFVNSTLDNLVNVALANKAYDVIKLFHEKNPDLIYYDNLEHQIPIAVIHDHSNSSGILPQIDELWEGFDKSLVKTDEQLLHMVWA